VYASLVVVEVYFVVVQHLELELELPLERYGRHVMEVVDHLCLHLYQLGVPLRCAVLK
jgi:hypothetical protein